MLVCPECGSKKIWKNALRYRQGKPIQRYLCRDCSFRFSNNGFKDCQTIRSRQICVSAEGAKNLVKVEIQNRKAQWESTSKDIDFKGKLVEYSWNLKRDGYAESTNKTYAYLLKLFVKNGADLNKPDSVKDFIALKEKWSNGRKRNAVKAYDLYTKMYGLTWEKPKYKTVDKPPFIPTEQEINSLISGCSKQMATFLQVLKETGARRGEAYNLTWDDIDFVSKVIRITPEKGSNARTFLMSATLVTMLSNLPRTSKRIWIYKNMFYLDKGFRRMRKKSAQKLPSYSLHFELFFPFLCTKE
jgi:integrase